MKVSDFNYTLPQELIAQYPLETRDSSRLMLVDKSTGALAHRNFSNIIDYLNPGDCLVLNDTRVIPARLHGQRNPTGGHVEFVLLSRRIDGCWESLVKPGRKAKIGDRFIFGHGELEAEIIDIIEEGLRIVKFSHEGTFEEILDKLGEMPLPPYITEKLQDKDRYQTVYSKHRGSAAAPTAGLHFTPQLLSQISAKNVEIAYITLHVGLGTFRPVKVDTIESHSMHSEYYSVDHENAKKINRTKQNGNRIVSVGTTTTRTLETLAKDGKLTAKSGSTNIFIYPPHEFKIVDALITNFHLPESTLIMLVSAFSTREIVLNAYKTAVDEKYRFFSFGDAMFLY